MWHSGIVECGRSGIVECGRSGIVECGHSGIAECGRSGIVECGRSGIGTHTYFYPRRYSSQVPLAVLIHPIPSLRQDTTAGTVISGAPAI